MKFLIIEELVVVQNGVRVAIADGLPESELIMCHSIEDMEMDEAVSFPDVIILSLVMYMDGDRVQQITKVKKLFPCASVIVYGKDLLPQNISLYFNAGINGYCSLEGKDLINCVKTVMAGKTYFNNAMVNFFVYKLQARERNSTTPPLTNRQYQIAHYLAKGMSISLIAKNLNLGMATVSTFKTQVFKKLAIQSVVELRAKLAYYPDHWYP